MKRLTLFLCLLLPCLGLSQTLLGLNAPPDAYDTSAPQVAVQKQVAAVAGKLGASVFRCVVPTTGINVERMTRFGKAAAANKWTVVAQFSSAAPSKAYLLTYPTSAWGAYNWGDYHCARMPLAAAIGSYTVQCLNTKVLYDALLSAGGSPQQLIVCLDNEPAPAKLVGGIWQSDWTAGGQYDPAYWEIVRAVAPLVRSMLPSGVQIGTPAFSGPNPELYARQWLAVAGQYVSRVNVNYYPGGRGYPALDSSLPFIDGYTAQMSALRFRLLDVTALPVSVLETAPANATDDAMYVAELNQIASWIKSASPFDTVCWFKPVAGGMTVSPANLDSYGLIYPDGTVSPALANLAAQ